MLVITRGYRPVTWIFVFISPLMTCKQTLGVNQGPCSMHIFWEWFGHKKVKPLISRKSSLGWIENYPILLKIASKLDDYLGIKHGLLENSPFNYSLCSKLLTLIVGILKRFKRHVWWPRKYSVLILINFPLNPMNPINSLFEQLGVRCQDSIGARTKDGRDVARLTPWAHHLKPVVKILRVGMI